MLGVDSGKGELRGVLYKSQSTQISKFKVANLR